PRDASRLALHAGDVSSGELADWAAEHAERAHPLKAAILRAAAPREPGALSATSSMAQWLVRRGGARAALGYRGAVALGWAQAQAERLFKGLSTASGALVSFEQAFAEARAAEPNEDAQWVLPVLYAA